MNTTISNILFYLKTKKEREFIKIWIKNSIYPSGYVYEIPLHKQPVFKKYNKLKLLNTEKYCSKHICLPIFYGMKISQAKYVVSTLKKILIS